MNRDPSNSAVLIGVISSSRSLDDDEGGMAVMGELEQAGLRVAARVEVGEEPHEIRRFIDRMFRRLFWWVEPGSRRWTMPSRRFVISSIKSFLGSGRASEP